MERELIPFTEVELMRDRGLHFRTVHQVRWCHRHRKERGLADAFVQIGGRWYIDPGKFHELARQGAAA